MNPELSFRHAESDEENVGSGPANLFACFIVQLRIIGETEGWAINAGDAQAGVEVR
jgi:hypothetical protein